MKFTFVLAFIAMVVLTASASLLLKTGVTEAPPGAPQWVALLNVRVIGGIASFGAAAFIYLWLLRWLPLYLVQSLGAAQFLASILGAAFLLNERIQPAQWAGILMIAAGIVAVAWHSN